MDLSAAVKDMVKKAEKAACRRLDDNQLLECLYNSYCRVVQKAETFCDRIPSSEGDVKQICKDVASELYFWYEKRYLQFGMQKGGKGSQGLRTVSSANTYEKVKASNKKSMFGKYGFSQLYAEEKFLSNFASTAHSEKGRPYMDFILHCCVAFFVPPEKVDALLLHYGFSRLHVKNIHHMAIYTVLNRAQSMPPSEIESFNPFAEIEYLYTAARSILNDGSADDAVTQSDYVIAGTQTNWVRDYLIGQQLSTKNMLQYISSNKSLFTMRHSLIIRDCWKYAKLYTHVYHEFAHRNPDGSDWYSGEDQYSVYHFMRKYCLSESAPTQKRFNEILFREIEKNRKHPSREFMVVLWLYNYCFVSMNNLEVSEYTIEKLSKSYRTEIHDGVTRDNAGEAARVKENYRNGEFSISKFIFHKNRADEKPFDGAAVVSSIQKRLTEYGWGLLNDNRMFDNYILSLQYLEIRHNGIYRRNAVYWKTEYISTVDSISNVPDALVVITALFDGIQKAMQTPKKPYYPLECKIYEQI